MKVLQDTIQTTKVLRTANEIVEDLIKWRDIAFEKVKNTPVTGPNDPLLIINKILYRGL